MMILCWKVWNFRSRALIQNEKIVNLEGHKTPQFSESVIQKLRVSGDLERNYNDDISPDCISLTNIRNNMGKKNIDLSVMDITKNYRLLDDYIEIGLYSRAQNIETDKVVYFIHGGGFIGGNFFQYENQLKLITEKTGVRIIAINYRLAPENKYPSSVIDCKKVYDWIVNSSKEFGWKKEKIIFLGDSAGVNLALQLVSQYEDVMFSGFINIYGCVDLFPETNREYDWSIDRYKIDKSQISMLESRLSKFSRQMKFFSKLYINSKFLDESNLFQHKKYLRIKNMLYIEAEFDYFRWSNRYFIENFLDSVDVKIITYKGVDHGFFERLGYCNETMDAIIKISDYINEI